jgi:hypothetical protein
LIRKFQPVWNIILDGFGNHAPGKGRAAGKISKRDVMRSGRPWILNGSELPAAGERPEEETKALLTKEVEAHLDFFFRGRQGP